MRKISHLFSHLLKVAVLIYGTTSFQMLAIADDIDIFVGTSGGSSDAPNVMFLMDDTSNWSTNAKTNPCAAGSCPKLPDTPNNLGSTYNTSQTVGGNELNAMMVALGSLYGTTGVVPNINVGLATFTFNGSTQNGYVRFGARNIADPTTGGPNSMNSYTSLMNMLSTMNPTQPPYKVNVGNKDEAESLYELYQYFNSKSPGALPVSTSTVADYPGNSNSGAQPQLDANGNNYTAYSSSNCGTGGACTYRGPAQTSCSKNFIIYISNHDHTNNGKAGAGSYNGFPSTALTPIAPWTVGGVQADTKYQYTWTWANYLYQNGITLYVIDVGGDASPSNPYSLALMQAAKLGGGKYFSLADATVMSGLGSLSSDLTQILTEIQAINTTFASVSLPINATNRTQNQNQVFIPMFRPDPNTNPLWKGNLKQYQLIVNGGAGGSIELADKNNLLAVNPNTGFASDCAQSFWTSDTSTTNNASGYWANVTENPSPKGKCLTSSTSVWSDSPDGPIVEKGGVAEVIRKGNNPPTTDSSPTWSVNRTVYTQPLAGGTLAAFTSASPGLGTATGLSSGTSPTLSNFANFILGQDVFAEYNSPPPPGISVTPAAMTRPSLHGDTIHSQPLPVNYGGNTGVYIYYGSNDGMLRAVNSSTGKEQWAFVAPEFYSRLPRLAKNSPLILYPGENTTGISPTPTKKDYFFDGSIGLYQNATNSQVWIYPTMRRGGRMLYAFDVTDPTSPVFKWKVGCPNLADDTGCVATSSSSWTGTTISSMGQTWSIPNVAASVQGYTGPVVIVGGGYDAACEDQDTATPGSTAACSSSKGAFVNVIDANTGALIANFPTGQGRSVAADVALIAMSTQGVVDHGYAVDTGGNIYRIDFNAGGPSTWVMNRVAYTNGAGRKFLFPPALFPNPGNLIYLALGSGDREHPLQSQYPYNTPVLNRFYVYRDDISTSSAVTNLDNMGAGTSIINVSPTASCSASTPNISRGSTSNGWFLNLNQYGQGEQTVTSAVIVGGMVTFSTNRPIPAASGSCSTVLGQARGYWLNLFSGSGAIGVGDQLNCGGALSSTFVGGGLPPSPVFANVQIGNQTYPVVIGSVQRQGGANSSIAPQEVKPTITPVRTTIFWRNLGID